MSICPTAGGLYEVIGHGGGIPPTICGEFFTSHLKAREALTQYLISKDAKGNAEYPGKPEELKGVSRRKLRQQAKEELSGAGEAE